MHPASEVLAVLSDGSAFRVDLTSDVGPVEADLPVSVTWSNSIGSSGYRHESWALAPDALIETTCLLRGDGGASCPVADAEKPDVTTPTRAPTV